MSKIPFSTFAPAHDEGMPIGLTNKKADDVDRELGTRWRLLRAGMYGGLTGYRCALTVGSWSAGRQPVFNVEEEYPPVSVS